MTDFKDFELDEETLRQITAEAEAEVNAIFELDEETKKLIQTAAAEEAGLDLLHMDDDFLALAAGSGDLSDLDLENLDLSDLDLSDLDLSDLDLSDQDLRDLDLSDQDLRELGLSIPAAATKPPAPAALAKPPAPAAPAKPPAPATPAKPPAPAAPAPVAPAKPPAPVAPAKPPAPTNANLQVRVVDDDVPNARDAVLQEAKQQAYERAREQALEKRKNLAVVRARKAARLRRHIQGHAQDVKAIDQEMVRKQGSRAMIGIIVGVVVLFVVLGGIFWIASNFAEKKEPGGPSRTVYRDGGTIATGSNQVDLNKEQKANHEFSRIRREARDVSRGRNASGEKIQDLIDAIGALRAEYPEFAESRKDQVDQLEEQLKGWLQLYASPASE